MPRPRQSPRKTRTARPSGRPRPSQPAKVDQLTARLEGLEQRLLRLEAGRAAPGDGRAAAAARPGRPVRRCPGCGLPLKARAGRCLACKRPIDSIS